MKSKFLPLLGVALCGLFAAGHSAFAQAEAWVQRFNGAANDNDDAYAVAVDTNGNVFVTGSSYPSVGSSRDFITIAYSSAGLPLWTNRYNGPGNDDDDPYAMAVDGSGNVIVTGPSTGTNLYADFATIKYSGAGMDGNTMGQLGSPDASGSRMTAREGPRDLPLTQGDFTR